MGAIPFDKNSISPIFFLRDNIPLHVLTVLLLQVLWNLQGSPYYDCPDSHNMTVLHMAKVKVHDCLNETIRSCKFYRYTCLPGKFSKNYYGYLLVMLWERHAKMGEYDFYSHCFYYFKRYGQWNCNAESLCVLQLFWQIFLTMFFSFPNRLSLFQENCENTSTQKFFTSALLVGHWDLEMLFQNSDEWDWVYLWVIRTSKR